MLPGIRQSIMFRYLLMPYVYSLHLESWLTGHAVVRPLLYEFPDDAKARDESFHYMLGRQGIVSLSRCSIAALLFSAHVP